MVPNDTQSRGSQITQDRLQPGYNAYVDLDYSGYHKNLIQSLFIIGTSHGESDNVSHTC